MCYALTLNDVGDHESSAGVVTDEMTACQVVFNLQGKQIPRDRDGARITDTTQTEMEERVGVRKYRKQGVK